MTRYFGLFAANHRKRREVVPRQSELRLVDGASLAPRYRVSWAVLLAKVYNVDATLCPRCKTKLRPVGAVKEPREAKVALARGLRVLGATGPPQGS